MANLNNLAFDNSNFAKMGPKASVGGDLFKLASSPITGMANLSDDDEEVDIGGGKMVKKGLLKQLMASQGGAGAGASAGGIESLLPLLLMA